MSWTFRTRWAERAAYGATTTALVAALGGCGLGPQSAPVAVQAPTTTEAHPGPSQAGVPLTIQVYLVQGDRLARVTRTVPPGAGLEPSFVGLATPLTRVQTEAGLRSVLPVSSGPLRGTVVDGVARVDLPTGFERISVHDQSLAMAQIVFTVTANSLATSAQLVEGGRALPVPDASGQLVNRPVSRVDYARFEPTG